MSRFEHWADNPEVTELVHFHQQFMFVPISSWGTDTISISYTKTCVQMCFVVPVLGQPKQAWEPTRSRCDHMHLCKGFHVHVHARGCRGTEQVFIF